jgi:dolichol-phosphate mannosyltransferase
MHRTAKNGLGAAYIAGFGWGIENGFTHLIEMDADGSHRPEDLVKLLAAADAGADLVLGSRYVRGGKTVNWPLKRQILSRGGNMYINIMLGTHINDMTGGFRVFTANLLETLKLDTLNARGYTFQTEMAYRSRLSGAKIVEVPITFVERIYGESKMDGNIVKEALTLVTKWGIGRIIGNTYTF